MASSSQPLDASTVLLLRPGQPFDVFLVRRHAKSRFMGGMYVFPGGKRDEADSSLELEVLCAGLDAAGAARILGHGMAPERAIGHYVAAIRETFEEADVLLAVDAAGAPIELGAREDELAAARAALQAGETTMGEVMRGLGWRMDLARLRYLDHWITPPIEPRRFTARFFLAEVPSHQTAAHDEQEVTDGVWLTPRAALDHCQDPAHHIVMAPPTLRVLGELAGLRSISDALSSAPNAPVTPNSPRLVMVKRLACLVLVGDPLHPDAPGERKNRFELQDGRWRSVRE